MIPAQAIKKFLSRSVDDHRWMKRLTHKKIDRLLDDLDPPPHFWHKLGLHQKIGLYLGIVYEYFAYWYDMGSGKTLLSLELLQYWWDIGELRRALVFVTSDKAFSTWARQIKQYKISVPFCMLDAASSKAKWRIFNNFDEGIILLHYPGTVAMVSERARAKNRKKNRMVLSNPKIDRLLEDVDAVVWDEVTKAGNHKSLTFRLCRKASKRTAFRYALAGMPFGRDPTPLWAQCYLVDHGETLGPTLGLFREAFFSSERNFQSRSEYSRDYTFKKRMQPKLSRLLQHRSLTYPADECIDLPPSRYMEEMLRLPETTRHYYQQVVDEVIAAEGNKRAMKNALHRMRQLSSGFMGLRDEETGERAEIVFEENPKLDRLLELIDALPRDRKCLIFYEYTFSGRLIVKTLKKEFGMDPIWLWSGTKNSAAEIERFIEGSDNPVVVNNRVGAFSLDGLQVANYEFFYESPLSALDRSQAERRTRRQGQLHRTCFYYDLLVRGTFDEKIREFHREGISLFDALLVNPARMLKS